VFASLANLTEQKKLEQAERQAREYAEALRDSTAMLTSTLDLDQVLDRILSNLAHVTAYDIANIMFIEDDVARVVRAQRHTGSSIDHSFYNNVGLSVSQSTYFARMIATHESVVIPNVATDPNWISFPETDWLKSYASAPLVINNKVIGFLNLDSSTPGFYNAEHAVRIRAFADQAAIAIQNARLFAETQRQATTDPLTGLHNRRHFTDLALGEIERARRYHHPLSLILLDIDHFKNVNDTLGHLAGDKVLQIIAEQIRASLRQTDLVGRHGGEEFIILLPETPIADAQTASLRLQKLIGRTDAYSTAERLRLHIQETHVETARGTASVTASLGVAQLTEFTHASSQSITPSHPLDALEQLIARADHALYVAKANGRNQVAVCTDD